MNIKEQLTGWFNREPKKSSEQLSREEVISNREERLNRERKTAQQELDSLGVAEWEGKLIPNIELTAEQVQKIREEHKYCWSQHSHKWGENAVRFNLNLWAEKWRGLTDQARTGVDTRDIYTDLDNVVEAELVVNPNGSFAIHDLVTSANYPIPIGTHGLDAALKEYLDRKASGEDVGPFMRMDTLDDS